MRRKTHEVANQPPPLVDIDLWNGDPTLRAAALREGGAGVSAADAALSAFGTRLGSATTQLQAAQANENPPKLRTHDRFGHRIDEVEYHPSYHALLELSVEHGLAGAAWSGGPGAHVARAAGMLLASQVEFGHLCPVSMTYSAVPALRRQPELLASWGPHIVAGKYDPRFAPAAEKAGVLVGMAMTEKQGGSDVRANSTAAEPDGDGFRLTGHKWFCSAPMSDAFLVLAQRPAGVTCFFLPRFTPDGARNAFFIQRLKDKLGNRSNASSEIELDGAWAWRIGDDGRGVPTIVEMVNHTRLDCVLGSAGLMRAAAAQALHHARHRAAFGRRLVEQPLMKNVLADLRLEAEAAMLLALRLSATYEEQERGDPHRTLRRIATAVAKYWVCKRAPGMVAEALECHGGNGYVEESPLPRIYREAPLNSIWEGSGNVICLDVLRAMAREPGSFEALLEEIGRARGADRRFDAFLARIERDRPSPESMEIEARRHVERLALALMASLLLRHAAPALADAFCAGRLEDRGAVYGTLPAGVDLDAIVTEAPPR
jgi:putative acyl-CoA dehydrogenase